MPPAKSKRTKARKPLVIDCFIFNDELDILDLRLNILDDVVDYHVVAESKKTFAGHDKPLYLQNNIDRFSKFKHKIISVVVSDFNQAPLVSKPHLYQSAKLANPQLAYSEEEYNLIWSREIYQRNAIVEGLKDFSPEDVVIISDLDEIPRPSAIKRAVKLLAAGSGPVALEQNFYYYFLNGLLEEKLYRAKLTKLADLTTPQSLRERDDYPVVKNAGWHFSYLGSTEKIITKLENFSHQEYNSEVYKNPAAITSQIKIGVDILNRPKKITYVAIDRTYPAYIRQHQDRLAKYIHPPTPEVSLSSAEQTALADLLVNARQERDQARQMVERLQADKRQLQQEVTHLREIVSIPLKQKVKQRLIELMWQYLTAGKTKLISLITGVIGLPRSQSEKE